MNISAMRKDWKNEGKNIIKKNINQSLRRGTYNNKNIEGFLTDVNVNGMEKNEAGRKNLIAYIMYTTPTARQWWRNGYYCRLD